MATQAKIDPSAGRINVPHIIKGELRLEGTVEHKARALSTAVYTPSIDLDELVWPRHEPVPAFDTPIAEIIDYLVELGERLDFDENPYLRQALEHMDHFSGLGRRILENGYRDIAQMFSRGSIESEIAQNLGGPEVLDGWVPANSFLSDTRVRTVPPRMVHIVAGNAPIPAPGAILRGALTKGVHLIKLPSNDMFTATAILRTMIDMAPNHPTTKSFSAVYWRGGDRAVESAIMRAQYFDKIVVWGGEAAVKHVVQYLGPGIEMISNDPKVSISMIGRAAFESEETVKDVARRSAADAIGWNQDACSAPRFQFVEGSVEQVDTYCEALVAAMGVDTRYGPGKSNLIPDAEMREELDMLGCLEPAFRLFGNYDGNGVVIRSDEPVSFNPTNKCVNVVRVDRLADAVQYVTVATQTVGIYPPSERLALRDMVVSAGGQVIVDLGEIYGRHGRGGKPHDGFMPLHRYLRWVAESGVTPDAADAAD